jgi:cobalt-zinc-cadmium efflux system outer membrane protein
VGAAAVLCAGVAAIARADLGGASAAPPPSSPELPAHLSLADALALFHQHGFDLLLADAAVASAEGDRTIAHAFPNPAVSAGTGRAFDYSPGLCESSGCSRQAWNASVSDQGLLFDLLVNKRGLKIAVAEAALQAARLQRTDAERELVAQLKQQYVDTVLAGQALGFAHEAAESSTRTADLVALRFRAGDVSEGDVARADTDSLQAAQDVDAAKQALASEKATLAYLLGVRNTEVDFELDPDLPPAVPPPQLAGQTAADLVALAREHRPDVAAARAQIESAQAAVALARRQRIPDVSFDAGYQQQGHGQEALQPPTATFGLSAALPLFYANAGEIGKAEAQLHVSQLQQARLDAGIVRDVTDSFASYQSATSRVQRMQGQMLERAQRARDVVDYQYRRGAASLLELLDAQRTFAATRSEYTESLSEYWRSFYELEKNLGLEW